ncbi:hypothetical protein LTR86_002073 [Recurvomyces mirabilis]|nr:hypothetical protein LTR86_002073 [Recurvomyces mirabilis]
MDERTFQRELNQLKSRVTDMAMKHSPRLAPGHILQASPSTDHFFSQVEDLKMHVAQLESTMSCSQPPPYLTGPTWEDFHVLESKLRGFTMDTLLRFENVEHDLAELDEKTDRLDPKRFTPASSDGNYEEGVSLFPSEADDILGSDSATYNDAFSSKIAASSPALEPLHSSFKQESSAPAFEDMTSIQVAQAFTKSKLEAANITLDILRQYNATNDKLDAEFDKDDLRLVENIVKLHTNLARDHRWNAPRLKEKANVVLPSAFVDPLAGLFEPEQPGGVSLPQDPRVSLPITELDARPRPDPSHPAAPFGMRQAEGVAFRDQEISRLDDLLRDAQEKARLSEQQFDGQRQALFDMQVRCDGRDIEVARLKADALQRDIHLQQMNDYLQSRDEQRDRQLSNFQQVVDRSREKTGIMASQERRIEKLQRILQDCQNSKDEEIDHILHGRSEEVRRLQGFCEQKDVVARSQEEIIARGAKLIQQRDDEIEALTRSRTAMEDDIKDERRQRLRVSKLLEERDGELVELKSELAARAVVEDGTRPQVDDREQSSPFEMTMRALPTAAPMWSPRPIPGNRRLANEARRASAWDQGERRGGKPMFGAPSPLGTWSKRDASPPRRRVSSPHPRAIRHLLSDEVDEAKTRAPRASDDRKQGHTSTSATREERDATGSPAFHDDRIPFSRSRNERHSLPLDRAVYPPLPVKVQSLADLRQTIGREKSDHRISKHQSMRELRRRALQPYVETEAESGGEFGGEV